MLLSVTYTVCCVGITLSTSVIVETNDHMLCYRSVWAHEQTDNLLWHWQRLCVRVYVNICLCVDVYHGVCVLGFWFTVFVCQRQPSLLTAVYMSLWNRFEGPIGPFPYLDKISTRYGCVTFYRLHPFILSVYMAAGHDNRNTLLLTVLCNTVTWQSAVLNQLSLFQQKCNGLIKVVFAAGLS